METIATIGGTIINNVMTMLSNLQVPGLNISFLTFYTGLLIVGFAFAVLGILFNIGRHDYFQDRNYERSVEKGYRKPGPRGY